MITAGMFMIPVVPVSAMTSNGECDHWYGMRRPNHSSTRLRVLAPGDRHGGGADRVLQHEVPADDPGEQLPHRRVGVGVGAAGDRDHRGELGVAEAGERAADAGDDERERDRRAGAVGDRGGGADEQPGADDRADPERDQRPRPQRAFERALARSTGVGEKRVDRLGSKQ